MFRVACIHMSIVSAVSLLAIPCVLVASALPIHAETNDQALCASDDTTDDQRIAACTTIIGSGSLDPKELAEAYRDRASALQGKEDFDRALADANEAVALDPGSAKAFFRRGDIYKATDHVDSALQDFNTAIQLDPNVPVYFIDRSNVYLDKRDYANALSDIAEALRLDPSDAGEAILNRCNILAHKGDFDAALADCQKGLQQHPDDPYAVGGLGFVYYKMGKYDEAIASYTSALGFSDLDSYDKAYLLYGRGLAKLKKDDKSGEADLAEAKGLSKTVYREFE
jgi:tetratricopeptide (TPR) repeat protein